MNLNQITIPLPDVDFTLTALKFGWTLGVLPTACREQLHRYVFWNL